MFVHFRSIPGPGFEALHEGQIASFEIESGDKGPQAVQVTESDLIRCIPDDLKPREVMRGFLLLLVFDALQNGH